ncbi:hypothetical protein H6G33_10370 [Calothrix sp. FACHB-1219]|uniref:hypothetical protein n=1 Tax=unclassified Calothrix TaxID=2619626 RepID=UPI001688D567|nr:MULTISPECIES: hypothetical protein [unclassified Calothrix]MBD2201751.1 hypothetical protein [Calothrix sp. FACHB-168]MBD2217437.1 hypothetical protein [Calothrix sp. FACHB-1219]
MTNNTAELIIDLIKDELRDVNLPQVFKAEDGARIVYYPKGSSPTTKGYTNPNATEVSLISPSGALVKVIDYNALCKDIWGENPSGTGKNSSSICHMKKGTRRSTDVQGWRLAPEETEELFAA